MSSNFNYNDAPAASEPRVSFSDLRVVDDAGGQHLEGVVYAGTLVRAFPGKGVDPENAAILPLNNIRPEHMQVSRKKDGTTVYREGTMEMKPGKQRRKIERWSRQLVNEGLPSEQRDPEARAAAVMGNLSVRLPPKYLEAGSAVLTDRDGNVLDLADLEVVQVVDLELFDGAQLDTAVDSLSRLKALFKANEAMPGCLDRRRVAVRVWISDDEQAAAIAHAYNQEGDPVNATAAKYRHQDTPPQALARAVVDASPHLGAKNVEVFSNTVSKNSPKLTSFNTISLAIEHGWPNLAIDSDEVVIDAQRDWLVDAWDALVKIRPEFGYTNLQQRQQWRRDTLAGTAVSVHGVIAVLASIYPNKDLSVLDKLGSPVQLVDEDGDRVLDGAGDPRKVDVFSYENPAWLDEGVLVNGKRGLVTRMSFQSRKAAADVLRRHLGL